MKKFMVFILSVLLLVMFTSCDQDKALKRTDGYYKLVRLVVTDPGVWDVLDDEQKDVMKKADIAYKEARKIAKAAGDKKSYAAVLAVGVGVLNSLSEYDMIPKKYKKEISIIRTSLNVYMVFLQDPE